MTALQFSPVDLEANRQGALSEGQVERMKGIRRRNILIAAAIFVGLVITATILIFVGRLNGSHILSAAGAILLAVNAILIGINSRSYMRVGNDLRAGNVEVLAGEVERVLRRGRSGDNYLLRIDGADLHVTRHEFMGFDHEAGYRIYRTSHSGVLLSAEPIS